MMNVVMQHVPLVFLSKSSIALMLLVSLLPAVHAEFTLNFNQPDGDWGSIYPGACNIGGFDGSLTMCRTAGAAEQLDPDTTPFYQDSVLIAGVTYWHQIVGKPEDGFAMDVWVPTYSTLISNTGGRPSNFPWGQLYSNDLDVQSGNGWDPLGLNPANDHKFTGNATGDPTQIVMRQVIGGVWDADTQTWSCLDNEICYEFLKDSLANKPKVTLELNDSADGMKLLFEVDMRAVDYSTDTVDVAMVNQITFDDNAGNFDVSLNAQRSLVTAGKYTFTAGVGWTDTGLFSKYQTWNFEEGSYSYGQGDLVSRPYDAGSFDHLNVDWASSWDPYQNPIGPGNETKCDYGVITGSCF